MNIFWIDHSFHKLTRSNDFFKGWLASFGYDFARQFHFDPSSDQSTISQSLNELILLRPDAVILFQLDFLGPILLAHGIPTIVIPMYDGSGFMPYEHWSLLRNALIINFSTNLHTKCLAAGCNSAYIKYVPNELDAQKPKHTSNLVASNEFTCGCPNILWWVRQSREDANWISILKFVNTFERYNIHLHIAPDDKNTKLDFTLADASKLFINAGRITSSTWFNNRSDYTDLLSSSDLYIAPRKAEGIGMSFLEAMNHGCCVVAPNSPTHNEYITHMLNGILVDDKYGYTGPKLDRKILNDMGTCGQVSLKLWHEVSNRSLKHLDHKIKNYICSYKDSGHLKPLANIDNITPSGLISAWQKGGVKYISYLSGVQYNTNFGGNESLEKHDFQKAQSLLMQVMHSWVNISPDSSDMSATPASLSASLVIIYKNILFVAAKLKAKKHFRLAGHLLDILAKSSAKLVPKRTREYIIDGYEKEFVDYSI